MNFTLVAMGDVTRSHMYTSSDSKINVNYYFSRVTKSMPEGVVTYHRQVLATSPQWEKSSSALSCLHVDSQGTIEDHGHGMLQVNNRLAKALL